MKIVIVNGSPRKGNTYTAVNIIKEAAAAKHEIEIINADGLNISPCKGCGACQCYKGCVAKDDSNAIVDQLVAADMIIFATPVYWWGVTAQIKTVIDKCYCKGALLKGKKIGIIVVGGASTEDEQYTLIEKQFTCMAKYLDWTIEFYRPYSATAKDDLANNFVSKAELKFIGQSIQ